MFYRNCPGQFAGCSRVLAHRTVCQSAVINEEIPVQATKIFRVGEADPANQAARENLALNASPVNTVSMSCR